MQLGKNSNRIASAAILGLALLSAAGAATIVTPDSLAGWAPQNVRTGGSVAITDANPRSGDGSLEYNLFGGVAKADFENYQDYGRLADLSSLSFDLYRDGSSTASQNVAFRLVVDNGLGQSNSQSLLIWEADYNGGGIASNAWTTKSIRDGNFWMRAYGPGRTIENYGVTLDEWLSGSDNGSGTIKDNGGNHYTPNVVGENARIVGLSVGVGSGWAGTYKGYVDNVKLGFREGPAVEYNFEPSQASAVPEPGTLALMGAGLLPLLGLRRRR